LALAVPVVVMEMQVHLIKTSQSVVATAVATDKAKAMADQVAEPTTLLDLMDKQVQEH
jgi:hypothetical protein